MATKFRYTLCDGERDAAVCAWVKKVDGHVLIQHDADEEVSRTHWHAILRGKKVEAFRLEFKRQFPGADYSFGKIKEGEEDVYERYMCHGARRGDTVKLIASHGLKYTQEWAQEQNEAFYDAREEFKKRIKKKGKQSTIDELAEECRAQQVRDVRGVAVQMYQMWKRQKRVFNDVYMSQVCKGVCVQLELPGYVQEPWVNRFMESFFL